MGMLVPEDSEELSLHQDSPGRPPAPKNQNQKTNSLFLPSPKGRTRRRIISTTPTPRRNLARVFWLPGRGRVVPEPVSVHAPSLAGGPERRALFLSRFLGR